MTTVRSALASTIGAVVLGASLAVGISPAQAAEPEPVVQAPCSITSKVITLGHDRWMVKARLYRADKRYPRHALTLNRIGSDGMVTPVATSVGTKKAKWNWRMAGALAEGETLQVTYAGDTTTLTCEGAVLTPKLRPRR